jgi:hypothetical protein
MGGSAPPIPPRHADFDRLHPWYFADIKPREQSERAVASRVTDFGEVTAGLSAEEPAPGSAARFPGPAGARELIAELIDSGARHFVLGPVGAPPLRWVADEIIRPVLGTAPR